MSVIKVHVPVEFKNINWWGYFSLLSRRLSIPSLKTSISET